MYKPALTSGILLAATAVILGAFGAHALKASISSSELDAWKTAVSYQFYHSLALLFLSNFSKYRSRSIRISYWAFTIGIILFSGSIYLLSIDGLLGTSFSFLGPVTPIGGMLFIIGWLFLLLAALKNK